MSRVTKPHKGWVQLHRHHHNEWTANNKNLQHIYKRSSLNIVQFDKLTRHIQGKFLFLAILSLQINIRQPYSTHNTTFSTLYTETKQACEAHFLDLVINQANHLTNKNLREADESWTAILRLTEEGDPLVEEALAAAQSKREWRQPNIKNTEHVGHLTWPERRQNSWALRNNPETTATDMLLNHKLVLHLAGPAGSPNRHNIPWTTAKVVQRQQGKAEIIAAPRIPHWFIFWRSFPQWSHIIMFRTPLYVMLQYPLLRLTILLCHTICSAKPFHVT